MKKMITLFILMNLCLLGNSYSQELFSGIERLFSKTSQEIISIENSGSCDALINSTLREVKLSKDGGFTMHYTYEFQGDQTSHIYSFAKNGYCKEYNTIQDVKNKDEQIVYFIDAGFKNINSKIFYHKSLDLMVEIDYTDKFVSFLYTRKSSNSVIK